MEPLPSLLLTAAQDLTLVQRCDNEMEPVNLDAIAEGDILLSSSSPLPSDDAVPLPAKRIRNTVKVAQCRFAGCELRCVQISPSMT